MRVHTSLVTTAIFVGLSMLLPSGGQTNSFTFEKIADFTTAIPDGKKTFTGLHDLSANDHGFIVFRARGRSGQRGIYSQIQGAPALVADANTVLPGEAGLLTSVRDLAMNSNGQSVFEAKSSSGQHGIYADVGGNITVIANLNTPIPGGLGNFTNLSAPLISDHGQVFFRGEGDFDQRGIYSYKDGILSVTADRRTSIPDGRKVYTNLRHLAINRHGALAFNGKGHTEQYGIYTHVEGKLTRVADRNTPIPDGIKTFKKFRKPSIDSENRVVFKGKGHFDQRGIYTYAQGVLEVVANQNTPVPGGNGNFSLFGIPSIDNGYVAFIGSGDNQGGLYTTLGGSLKKVLSTGEGLDGKTVSEIVFRPDGLRGNTFAFKVIFADSTRGLYLASLQHE